MPWVSVAAQLNGQTAILDTIVFDNGPGDKLYGLTLGASLFQWDGIGAWTEVAPTTAIGSGVGGLAVMGGDLYAGGNPADLIKWNNVDDWDVVAPSLDLAQGFAAIGDLIVMGGVLYGCTWSGTFWDGELWQFNGTNAWVSVAPQINNQDGYSLAVFNGKIYCGTIEGRLLEWNGVNAWVEVAPQLTGNLLARLVVFDNGTGDKLYAGMGGTGGVSDGALFQWNGTNAWVMVADHLAPAFNITSTVSYNTHLYGGTSPNGNLYRWNNVDVWVSVAAQLGAEVQIYGLTEFNGVLYGGTGGSGKLYRFIPPGGIMGGLII